MSTDTLISELLRRYTELLDSGHPASAEELGRDYTELLAELKQHIEAAPAGAPAHPATTRTDTAPPTPPHAGNGGPDSPGPPAEPTPPTRYRPLRFHARGGLGEVFVAEDLELHRTVALKRIRPPLARDPDSRQRFVLEARLTGRLEHPGIVPVHGLVYDTADGPSYAMRFIQGETLSEAIRRFHEADRRGRDPGEREVALRQLLGRFVAACNAVAYAHSRGILHRDLKPSNILVDRYGETLVADWGLAKDTLAAGRGPEGRPVDGGGSTSGSGSPTPTRGGRGFGTRGFMSPEQAAGDWDRVGPASDVYALGATLRTVLTGHWPAVTGPTAGQPAQLAGGLPAAPPRPAPVARPLRAICDKAMAPDPRDRYATALDLATDVEQWLAGEPVSAWPEPPAARARRWLGRHRTLTAVALAAVLVAAACLGVATGLLAAAGEREHRERARAEANFQLARAAVDRYYTEVSQDVLLNQPGMEDLRRRLLETAREFYRVLVRQGSDDPAVRAEYGRTHWRLAFITSAIDSKPQAVEDYRRAVAVFEELVGAHPEVRSYRYDLGKSYNNLGLTYGEIGQPAEAEAAYDRALALFEELAAEDPAEPEYAKGVAATQNNRGLFYRARGDNARAEEAHQKALAVRERLAREHTRVAEFQHDHAASLNNLGVVYLATRRREKAEEAYKEALAIRRRLVEAHPGFATYRHDLANSHNNLAQLYSTSDRPGEAEAAFQAAEAIWIQLVRDHPRVVEYHNGLAANHTNRAGLLARTSRPREAEECFRQAITLYEDLARAHPARTQFAVRRGASYCNMGTFLKEQNDPTAALEWYARAIPLLEGVLNAEPEQADARRFLRNAHWGRGEALTLLKRHPEAIADFDRAAELATGPGREMMQMQRAGALARMGRHAQAVAEAERLASRPAAAPGVLYNVACVYALAAGAVPGDAELAEAERARLAERYAVRAVELLTQLHAAGFFKSRSMVEHLHQDRDLDALRSRADLGRLLEQLQPVRKGPKD
jgi:serine/threonine-protein kinase